MTNIIIILYGSLVPLLRPISQILYPKKFVKLLYDKSLFQLMLKRNSKVYKSQFIVLNEEQYILALDRLEEFDLLNNSHILEPIGRNMDLAISRVYMLLQYDTLNYFETKRWKYASIRQHTLPFITQHWLDEITSYIHNSMR